MQNGHPIRAPKSGLFGWLKRPSRDELEWRAELEALAHDPEVRQARAAVLVGGLPESVALAAERRGQFDWRPLAAALDTLYAAKGGSLGVRAFLMSPQRSLSGGVPIDLIARKGELQQVARAAYDESARTDLARFA
jgi:hypothetical protein